MIQLTTKIPTSKQDLIKKIINWRIKNGHSKSRSHFLMQCVMSAVNSSEEKPIAFLLPTQEELTEMDKPKVNTEETEMKTMNLAETLAEVKRISEEDEEL